MVHRWNKSGRLPCLTSDIGRLIHRDDVDALAEARRQRAAQRPGATGAANTA
jgi:predicted site-specific integrase-resolvase